MDKAFKDINDIYYLSRILDDLESTLSDLQVLNSTTRDANVKLLVLKTMRIIEKMDFNGEYPQVRKNNYID